MFIASIVAASIFIAAMIVMAVFLYSYAIYTKNRLFQKTKLSILLVVLVSIVILCLIGFGIFLTLQAKKGDEKQHEYVVQFILVYVLAFLMLSNFIAYLTITLVNSKNKLSYLNIADINWTEKIDNLKKTVNIEKIKNKLATKHKKYFQNMISSYQTILQKAKNSDIKKSDLIADIVLFNENFTSKWSTCNNNYQLLLTYEFCKIFNK